MNIGKIFSNSKADKIDYFFGLFVLMLVALLSFAKLIGIGEVMGWFRGLFDTQTNYAVAASLLLVLLVMFRRYVKWIFKILMYGAIGIGSFFILNNTPVTFYLQDIKRYFYLDNYLQKPESTNQIQPVDQSDNNSSEMEYLKMQINDLITANKSMREQYKRHLDTCGKPSYRLPDINNRSIMIDTNTATSGFRHTNKIRNH